MCNCGRGMKSVPRSVISPRLAGNTTVSPNASARRAAAPSRIPSNQVAKAPSQVAASGQFRDQIVKRRLQAIRNKLGRNV